MKARRAHAGRKNPPHNLKAISTEAALFRPQANLCLLGAFKSLEIRQLCYFQCGYAPPFQKSMLYFLQAISHAGSSCVLRLGDDPSGQGEKKKGNRQTRALQTRQL